MYLGTRLLPGYEATTWVRGYMPKQLLESVTEVETAGWTILQHDSKSTEERVARVRACNSN